MTDIGNTANVSLVTRSSVHSTGQFEDLFINDEARRVLEIIFYSALGGLLGVVGSAVNVINVIIFFKQGFSDSVSIGMCALAVSDLGFLLPMMWISICLNPQFRNLELTFDTADIHYITGALPHSWFARITTLITAFITFERCVCIALPMEVKNLFTPKRTLIFVVGMFAIILAANVPIYTFIYLGPSFQPERNKTLIRLKYTRKTKDFENFSFSFSVFAQISSFIIVTICTTILVLKLLSKSKRSHRVIISGKPDSISARDKRVMKMVALISVVFIVCYFPSAVNLILMVFLSPEYSLAGRYENSCFVSWAIISVIEGINSSVTILIYYNMSSKFRATFKELFSTKYLAMSGKWLGRRSRVPGVVG